MFPVDVFKYISPTTADVIPELENAVGVVDVPVIAVPEYHTEPRVPPVPCFDTVKLNFLLRVIPVSVMTMGIVASQLPVTFDAATVNVSVGCVVLLSFETVMPLL